MCGSREAGELRVSTHTGYMQDLLAKSAVFKYTGVAAAGEYGGSSTAGKSRSYKYSYNLLHDESFVAAAAHHGAGATDQVRRPRR